MTDPEQTPTPGRIRPLDPTVVNRIAAGEIVVAPANALKELLENSVDAGSTAVDILVKDDGLKMLQITDNGVGIHKDDLAVLCNRFTTSKLSSFEDLNSIATYGFRGEALASISHISHLSVTTKTRDAATAYKANYRDGELKSGPSPCAGRKGTQITVEDLFFNMPSRLKTFRSKSRSEGYQKIVDVVARYAVHCKGISFSCKRLGDSSSALAIPKDFSTRDKIRTVYGSLVDNELIELSESTMPHMGVIKVSGYVTNSNYSSRKQFTPALFINHRYVSCDPLRKALNQIYATYLPKGGHPFIYLSLELDPANVDVNVHPTKREVRFLYESEIVDYICEQVQGLLTHVDTSRTFQTQTLLSGGVGQFREQGSQISPSIGKIPERKLVRTDPKQVKLTAFTQSVERPLISSDNFGKDERPYRPVSLSSIKRLRKNVEASIHSALTKVFMDHTFVGVVDYKRRLAAIQQDVRLYLVDYGAISRALFYQTGLAEFGNFGRIEFDEGLPVTRLMEIGECSREEIHKLTDLLSDDKKRQMLLDYFAIEISKPGDDDNTFVLDTLPLLIKDYTPPFSKLPIFFQKLVHLDWNDELSCLRGILHELSLLYIPLSVDENDSDEIEQIGELIEKQIFPALKQRLLATEDLQPYVIEIANLPGLYKIFERC